MKGKTVSFVGINTAGITSKMQSFDKLLYDIQPSIFMLQESKRRLSAPSMKAKNLFNYQVFELRRQKTAEEGGKGLSGGGLVVGALHDLQPVLVRQGDDIVECITIEVTAGATKIRCVNGYGPQIGDSKERKEKFWNYLDKEVFDAEENDIGLVIEIDSNSWAGSALIPNDPNTQNGNGKLLELFLHRNKGMCLVNSYPLCHGLITRKRETINRHEKAAMDLFIVCKRIFPSVLQMNVDELGKHQLTNFNGIRHKRKVTQSDHAMIQLTLDLQFPQMRQVRNELYNFKCKESQNYFKGLTTNTRKFSICFEGDNAFKDQIRKWQSNLKSCIVQSFSKIRSRKRKFSESEIGELLEKRKKIKLDIITNP